MVTPPIESQSRCENCLTPSESGVEVDGTWYCSAFCAEVAAGYWSRSLDTDQ